MATVEIPILEFYNTDSSSEPVELSGLTLAHSIGRTAIVDLEMNTRQLAEVARNQLFNLACEVIDRVLVANHDIRIAAKDNYLKLFSPGYKQ